MKFSVWPSPERSWAEIAGLAAVTERIRLGSLVSPVTFHHPVVLAKRAMAVDHVSNGRAVLGMGAGWQVNEHRAYGIDFFTVKERLDRLEEACEVLHSLFHNERTTFDGRYYQLVDAPLSPKPAGPLPLLIGGGGEQRTLRIAARWADEWNVWGTPEILRHKGEVLDRHCEDIGRDPGEIVHSAQALLFLSEDQSYLDEVRGRDIGRPAIIGTAAELQEVVAGYAEAGVDELIVPDFNLGPLQRKLDTFDRFLAEVASAHH